MNLIRRNSMMDEDQMPVCNNTAYCSLIPEGGSYSGRLYRINLTDGSLTMVKNYPSYYFTSMEFIKGDFYVYLNDFTKGFGTVDITTGYYTKIFKISKGMTDLSYDSAGGVLYGLRYGKIWSLDTKQECPVQVYSGSMNFIAIAANGGDMYAIESNAAASPGLYRFRGCDFTLQPELIMSIGRYAQYTQSMAFVPGTRRLYWSAINRTTDNRRLVCIDLTDLQDPKIIGSVAMSVSLGGLVIMEG